MPPDESLIALARLVIAQAHTSTPRETSESGAGSLPTTGPSSPLSLVSQPIPVVRRPKPSRRRLLVTPCHTCGRLPIGTYHDGSPRYDHGHGPDGSTWVDSSRRGGSAWGAIRLCPACRHEHAVGTTCLECPECGS